MSAPVDDRRRLERCLVTIQELRARLEEAERWKREPVAVIGMGCRFPGAGSPAEFWRLLSEGRCAVGEVPAGRWRSEGNAGNGSAEAWRACRRGGFLADVESIDAAFFGISPVECEGLDPQQRLLLEVGWEALEDAGLNPRGLEGERSERGGVGIFLGICEGEYGQCLRERGRGAQALYGVTGTASSVAAARLAYLLDLHGPSVALDTACSSSLVAVHLAVTSLRQGECGTALAGGVNLLLVPDTSLAFHAAGALAEDGRCKAFDAAADGYGRGEGCGMVVLRRLSDALRDGDPIRAVIRGSAINQDGRTNGLTAPNRRAQEAVIRAALANAGVESAEVGYLEAHGTGTPLGDPIEIGALGEVFGGRSERLRVGAVKTNLGHLEAAAGVAGLIKSVLCLERGVIPPTLHLTRPNPRIPWGELPLRVPTACESWEGERRVAGVSSFGFSGTNAHVVLGASPVAAEMDPDPPDRAGGHVLVLSARTAPALAALASRFAEFLDEQPAEAWAAVAHTANLGRHHFAERLAVVAADARAGAAVLRSHADAVPATASRRGSAIVEPRVAFLFPGQGSQHPGMARQLFGSHPGFRATVEECDAILRRRGYLDRPLADYLHASPGSDEAAALDSTRIAQPAIFAVEVALARLWQGWGVQPAVVMGHSVGEYVAACVAGVFTLEEGLCLVAERARLIEERAIPGSSAAVFVSPEKAAEVLESLGPDVGISGRNSPRETLIAGLSEKVDEALKRFGEAGYQGRRLRVTHAPHSRLVEPVLAEFEVFARRTRFAPPVIPLVSNLTGERASEVDAAYWTRHLRQPVDFIGGMRCLSREQCGILLEVGTQPILQLLGRQNWTGPEVTWLSSLWAIRPDWEQLSKCVAELHVRGVDIHWREWDAGYRPRRRHLPTYPFQRARAETIGSAVPVDRGRLEHAESPAVGNWADQVAGLVAAQLGWAVSAVDRRVSFVEMGADSLLLGRLSLALEERFGVEIGIGQLFEDLDSVEAVASHLERVLQAGWTPLPSMVPEGNRRQRAEGEGKGDRASADGTGTECGLPELLRRQIEMVQGQLELLRRWEGERAGLPLERVGGGASPWLPPRAGAFDGGGVRAPSRIPEARPLDERQRRHVEALASRYVARTRSSYEQGMAGRGRRADARAMRMFRKETQAMVYPILARSAGGARFEDLDGNGYLDLAMGVGVQLFGHGAGWIADAVRAQLGTGLMFGPTSALADEVATRIAALTGMERMAFQVTGTGAVNAALRLAQASTGRSRFAMFSGAYHGQADRTLGVPGTGDDEGRTVPMSVGISGRALEDAWVLPYGDPRSIDALRERSGELGAVLVEPVQSRNPALQPVEFLQRIRDLTRREGIPLIFDEIITGFRVHPGGVQAKFGIEADLVTYGKCLGGGMPVSVVAGKSELLDRVDGGAGEGGGGLVGRVEPTFVGSTFGLHPLGLASARAVLEHLQREGPGLQEALNARTARLATSLNAWFEHESVPFKVAHFGSVFRFVWKGNTSYAFQPLEVELFHLHLIHRGFYFWEGRTCFVSTAHTEADLEGLAEAVRLVVSEMREGGFLRPAAVAPRSGSNRETGRIPGPGPGPDPGHGGVEGSTGAVVRAGAGPSENGVFGAIRRPLSDEQRLLWRVRRRGDRSSPDWTVPIVLRVRGDLRRAAWEAAVQGLVDRHDALRTVFGADGSYQEVRERVRVEGKWEDYSGMSGGERERATREWLAKESAEPFDLTGGPLLRSGVVRWGDQDHVVALIGHHLVMDGWSVGIMLADLKGLYGSALAGDGGWGESGASFGDFLAGQAASLAGGGLAEEAAGWRRAFPRGCAPVPLPTRAKGVARRGFRGARYSAVLEGGFSDALRGAARGHRCTLFMLLLGAYGLMLHRASGEREFVVGTPTAGRTGKASQAVVGYCTHFLPVRIVVPAGVTLAEYWAGIRAVVLEAFRRQRVPFASWHESADSERPFPISVVFNLDRPETDPGFPGLVAEFLRVPTVFALTDLRLDAVEAGAEIWLDYDYSTELFREEEVGRWHGEVRGMLEAFLTNPGQRVEELPRAASWAEASQDNGERR